MCTSQCNPQLLYARAHGQKTTDRGYPERGTVSVPGENFTKARGEISLTGEQANDHVAL